MKKVVFSMLALTCFSLYLTARQPQDAVKASIARGEKLYQQYCLTCHQKSGNGVPRMNPPLVKTTWVLGDKTKLITWVLKGSSQSIPIDGKTYSNNMPAQNYLKDGQVADVLTYVRNSFGNVASAITPADVKAVRATIK